MVEEKEKPLATFQKNAETTTNKIRLPKWWCEQNGYNYYVEIYGDHIKIIPIRKDS